MIGKTLILEKSVKSTAAVAANTIAKPGADDDTYSTTTAAGDEMIGIFQHATSGAGEEVRLGLAGVSLLKLGGTVTRGDWLTSDVSGQGVAASPATGVNNSVIAKALASGVSGDIIPVLLAQGKIQG
jgi:hypothetical protein